MNAQVVDAVIKEQVKQLKVPAIGRSYVALAGQAGESGWSYAEFLRELLDEEIGSRQERTAARRLWEAHFPDVKTLNQIDWEAMNGVGKQRIIELSSCEYIEVADNVVIAGPIGTGKTHLAIALGVEAARRWYRVVFTRAAELVQELLEARDVRSLGRLHQRIKRAALLIVDEFGFVPFARAGGELLFNLLSERHERKSTIITTNLAFSEWVQVLGDEKLTTALLDRLAYKAYILTTKGASYRMNQRRKEAWLHNN